MRGKRDHPAEILRQRVPSLPHVIDCLSHTAAKQWHMFWARVAARTSRRSTVPERSQELLASEYYNQKPVFSNGLEMKAMKRHLSEKVIKQLLSMCRNVPSKHTMRMLIEEQEKLWLF